MGQIDNEKARQGCRQTQRKADRLDTERKTDRLADRQEAARLNLSSSLVCAT